MSLKIMFRYLHLILGLTSGLVIFTVAITGCVYAFEKELRSIIHGSLYVVTPVQQKPLELSLILMEVQQKFPKSKIKSLLIQSEKNKSIQVQFKNKQVLFINPYTGEHLGKLDMESEFFTQVLNIHRRLCMGDTGKLITGISALIFLTMLISGIVLWWPSRIKHVKHKTRIPLTTHKKALAYQLHQVLGFYASWILFISVLTGLIWSFKWAEKSMYTLSGSKMEGKTKFELPNKGALPGLVPATCMTAIIRAYPSANAYFLQFPDDNKGVYRAIINDTNKGLFLHQHQAYFNPFNGQLLKLKTYEQSSKGDKLKSNNYNFHTGKILGLTGQVLVFLAGLVAASLPITGFMIWLGKRK